MDLGGIAVLSKHHKCCSWSVLLDCVGWKWRWFFFSYAPASSSPLVSTWANFLISMLPFPSFGASAKILSAFVEKNVFFWFFVSFLCDGGMLAYLACAEFLAPGHQGVSQTVNRCMDYSGVNMVRLDLRILVAKTISFVELSKSIEDDVLLIGTLRSVSENSQEHGEVDWTWCFFDHRFKFSIGAKTTQWVEGSSDVVLRKEPIFVLVDELESLFKFLHLMLGEPALMLHNLAKVTLTPQTVIGTNLT